MIDIGLDASSKKDGEEKLALLRKNADDISLGLDEIDAELDDESKLEEEGDDDSDDEAGMTPEDKVAKHKAKWQKRAEKYRKYADKGKVDKLQRANEKQTHKLQKVRARAPCHQQHQPWTPTRATASLLLLLLLLSPSDDFDDGGCALRVYRPRTRASRRLTLRTSRQSATSPRI